MSHFSIAPVGLPGLAAIALGAFAFLVALIAARRRAARSDQSVSVRKANASWIWIAVQSVGIFIVAFGPVDVRLDPLSFAAIIEGLVTLALMACCVALFHWSSSTMGKNWSIVARTRDDHQLVETGPFAYIRHPIYVALFLFMIAFAIAHGHWLALVPGVPIYILGTVMRIRYEETLLRAQFGAAYDDYTRRVKRFLPGLI
jgi:protein-S-isoprenylcysteine O-methyltransferase Ste14